VLWLDLVWFFDENIRSLVSLRSMMQHRPSGRLQPLPLHCPSGHALFPISGIPASYKTEQWFCDICSTELPLDAQNVQHCPICSYDVCKSCHVKHEQSEKIPIIVPQTATIIKPEQLITSTCSFSAGNLQELEAALRDCINYFHDRADAQKPHEGGPPIIAGFRQ
jgi:hypothetical protein